VSLVRLPRALLLGLPILCLVVPACSDAAGPSKEEYAAMADGVCKDAGEQIDALYMDYAVEQFELSQGMADDSIWLDRPERWVRVKVVAKYESMSGALKGIQPPDGDGAYLSDLYADLDARIATLHRRPGDGRAVIETDTQVRDRFESYGITECPPAFDETPKYEDPAEVLEEVARRREEEAKGPAADETTTTAPPG
jgi:hypothetical protein